MNCLNAAGSGINCKKSTDILSKNGFIDGTSTTWTANIDGLMTLIVIGGSGKGGNVGGTSGGSYADKGGGGGGGGGYVNTVNDYQIIKGTIYQITIGRGAKITPSTNASASIFNNNIYAYGGGNGGTGGNAAYNYNNGNPTNSIGRGGGEVEEVDQLELAEMEQMELLLPL